MKLTSRRTPLFAGVAGLLAAAAFSALPAAAQTAAPAPCNGMFTTDPAGDAEYLAGGTITEETKPGTPNMDITGVFFNHRDGATTMNTVLANLDKTVPPASDIGASGGIWYYGYYKLGDETRFVRAANKSGGDIEYAYGYIIRQLGVFITEGTTTGSFTEGPNGVVSITIPPEAGGNVGDTLTGFIATVDTIEGEDDFFGINHQADWSTLAEGAEDPSLGNPNGLDYTVAACPAGATPPPAGGGGVTPPTPPSGGGGGTTPPPSGGGSTGGGSAPTFTTLPFKPVKASLGSAKKAKRRGLSFKAAANADITNLVVKLRKGSKTLGTGKAASFKRGTRTFKLKTSKRLKKGKYNLIATGVVGGKKLSVKLPVSVKR